MIYQVNIMNIKVGDNVLIKTMGHHHQRWVKVTEASGSPITGQVFAEPKRFHYGVRMTDIPLSHQYKVPFTEDEVISRYTRELDINLRLRRLVEMGIEGDGPIGLNRGSGFWKMAVDLINNHKHLVQQTDIDRSYTYCLWDTEDVWHDKHDPKKSTVRFTYYSEDEESESDSESSDEEVSLADLKQRLDLNDRKLEALEKMMRRK